MKNDVDERFDSSGCSYGHGYSESAWKPVELKSGSSVFFNGLVLLRNVAFVIVSIEGICCIALWPTNQRDFVERLQIITCRPSRCYRGLMTGRRQGRGRRII